MLGHATWSHHLVPNCLRHNSIHIHKSAYALETIHTCISDGHTPVQRRLRIRKERLSGVAIVQQPCLLCGGQEETPVQMHVRCAHSRLLWPNCRLAVQEAARHLPSGDKALWVASRHSAGAKWTEVFCSGLVPEAAEAQLRAIARYEPLGGNLRGRVPPAHAPAPRFRVIPPQPPAGAIPPRAPQRGRLGAPMAHCGGRQLPPPSPASQQGLRGLPPPRERHPGVSPAGGPPPLPGPAWGFLEAPPGRIGRNSMTRGRRTLWARTGRANGAGGAQ